MMESGDMPVLETGAAMRAGSTPVIGTLPLSSKDRMSGYEPEDTRSIRVAETNYDNYFTALGWLGISLCVVGVNLSDFIWLKRHVGCLRKMSLSFILYLIAYAL
jgi:hypothetical protein